ncbi:MAG: element excision factor XisI family protein, partial [Blastocatellia bacterium]
MDKLTQYRKIAEEILREFYDLSAGGLGSSSEDQIVVDHNHGHYQLLRVGWSGMRRIYGCPLHIDIRDGKFWIQR